MKIHGVLLSTVIALTSLTLPAWGADPARPYADPSKVSNEDLEYLEKAERESGDSWRRSAIDAENRRVNRIYYVTLYNVAAVNQQMANDLKYVQGLVDTADLHYRRAGLYREERIRRGDAAKAKLAKAAADLKWSKEVHFTVSLPEDMKDATVVVNQKFFYPGKEVHRTFDWAGEAGKDQVYEVQIELIRKSERLLSNPKKITLKAGDKATRVAFTEINFP